MGRDAEGHAPASRLDNGVGGVRDDFQERREEALAEQSASLKPSASLCEGQEDEEEAESADYSDVGKHEH